MNEFNTTLALSVNQAAKRCSIGRSKIYEEIQAGRLKSFRLGTRRLIASQDLEAWLNAYRNVS